MNNNTIGMRPIRKDPFVQKVIKIYGTLRPLHQDFQNIQNKPNMRNIQYNPNISNNPNIQSLQKNLNVQKINNNIQNIPNIQNSQNIKNNQNLERMQNIHNIQNNQYIEKFQNIQNKLNIQNPINNEQYLAVKKNQNKWGNYFVHNHFLQIKPQPLLESQSFQDKNLHQLYYQNYSNSRHFYQNYSNDKNNNSYQSYYQIYSNYNNKNNKNDKNNNQYHSFYQNYYYNNNNDNKNDKDKNSYQQNLNNNNKEDEKIKLSEIKNDPIAVIFISIDQNITYPVAGYDSDNFSKFEEKLFLEYPELKNKNIYYLANGSTVDKSGSLESNKIKNGTNILINFAN